MAPRRRAGEYEARRAERRYRAVDPDNRLVARGLEREWEESLRRSKPRRPSWRAANSSARACSRARSATPARPRRRSRRRLARATTTPRDRKELLRTLLEEVIIKVERDKAAAQLTLRWHGGALTEIDLALPRSRPATVRTDEDTIALVRRLAVHYPDAVIAGILNRQGRTTARGQRFDG